MLDLIINQHEGMNYDKTYAPVARLKAIRIFSAFSTYMNFIVYQMDVKSAFLNGKLKEEVYVKQPSGFESNEFLNHACKSNKAHYGLKQAPRAWYETLSTFLTEHKFVRGLVVSFSTPTGGIYSEVWVNMFNNAIGAHYLPYSSEYVTPPSINIVRPWFETIGYGETVPAKGTLKKSLLPPSEATKCGSSKRPTGSKTGHLKRKKESSSAMDSNLSQTSASTLVVAEMHKEDLQATCGPTSLGVTSKERANPQLSSVFTAEADPGKSAPSDFIPQQQGMNEGTKNTSYDHLFAGTDPHVLADKTQYVSEGLETVLTQPITGKGASFIARQASFKDLDSPKDDPIIVVDDSDEDEEADEVHATTNAKTEDTLVPKSSSPRSSQIQELTNQVLILQSQKHKLELEKNKAEAEAALLRA
ncbi:retrovirus-related pol polyprotein from transposon TNT 1-94 [Tanacetum coccineum]